jgi:hypothetical protein
MLILTSRSTRAIRTRRVFDPNQPRHRNSPSTGAPGTPEPSTWADDAAGLLGPRLGGISRTRRRAERRAGLKQIAFTWTVEKAAPYAPPSTVGLSHTPVRGPPLHRTLRLRNGPPCRSGGPGSRPEPRPLDKIGNYRYTFLLAESPPAGAERPEVVAR